MALPVLVQPSLFEHYLESGPTLTCRKAHVGQPSSPGSAYSPSIGVDRSQALPTLEGYRFGDLIVNGKEQTRDLIVLPERVITNWWRIEGHAPVLEDLDAAREDLPEHLVIDRCVRADAS